MHASITRSWCCGFMIVAFTHVSHCSPPSHFAVAFSTVSCLCRYRSYIGTSILSAASTLRCLQVAHRFISQRRGLKKKNSWFLGRPSLNWHRENLRKVKTTLEIFTTAPNEWRLDDIDFIASTICPNLSKGAKNVLYFTCLLPNILTLLMCYISFNVQRPKTRIISTAFWASP